MSNENLKERFVEWCCSHLTKKDGEAFKDYFINDDGDYDFSIIEMCKLYSIWISNGNLYDEAGELVSYELDTPRPYAVRLDFSGLCYFKDFESNNEFFGSLLDENKNRTLFAFQVRFENEYVLNCKLGCGCKDIESAVTKELGLNFVSVDMKFSCYEKHEDEESKINYQIHIPMYNLKYGNIQNWITIDGNTYSFKDNILNQTCYILRAYGDENKTYRDILSSKRYLIVDDYLACDGLYKAYDGSVSIVFTGHSKMTKKLTENYKNGTYITDFNETPIDGIQCVKSPKGYTVRKYGDIKGYDRLREHIDAQLARLSSKAVRFGNGFFQPRIVDNFLVENLIGRHKECLLFGRSGSFKSFISLDLALTICTDQPSWMGHNISGGGCVLYLASEAYEETLERILAWCQYHNIDGEKLDTRLGLIELTMKLDTVAGRDALLQEIESTYSDIHFDLVIVDTARRSMSGNENDSNDVESYLNGCKLIAEHLEGATYLVVHHTGKSEDRNDPTPRGSKAWIDHIDTALFVANDLRSGISTLKNVKQRVLKTGDVVGRFKLQEIELDLLKNSYGNHLSSAIAIPADTEPSKDAGSYSERYNKMNNRNKTRIEKITKAILKLIDSGDVIPVDGKATITRDLWAKANGYKSSADNNEFRGPDKSGKPNGFEVYVESNGWGNLHFDENHRLESVTFDLMQVLPENHQDDNYF